MVTDAVSWWSDKDCEKGSSQTADSVECPTGDNPKLELHELACKTTQDLDSKRTYHANCSSDEADLYAVKTIVPNSGPEVVPHGIKATCEKWAEHYRNTLRSTSSDLMSVRNSYRIGRRVVEHGYKSNSIHEETDSTAMQGKETGAHPHTPMGGELSAWKDDSTKSVCKYNDREPYSPMNGMSTDDVSRKESQETGNPLPLSLSEGPEEVNDGCCGDGVPQKMSDVTDSPKKHGSSPGMLARHMCNNTVVAILDEPPDSTTEYGRCHVRHPYHTLAGNEVNADSTFMTEQCCHTYDCSCEACVPEGGKETTSSDPQNDGEPAGGRTVGGCNHPYTNVNGDVELRAPTYHLDVNTWEKIPSERSQLLSPTVHCDGQLPNDNYSWLRLTSENLEKSCVTAGEIGVYLMDSQLLENAEYSRLKREYHVEERKLNVEDTRENEVYHVGRGHLNHKDMTEERQEGTTVDPKYVMVWRLPEAVPNGAPCHTNCNKEENSAKSTNTVCWAVGKNPLDQPRDCVNEASLDLENNRMKQTHYVTEMSYLNSTKTYATNSGPEIGSIGPKKAKENWEKHGRNALRATSTDLMSVRNSYRIGRRVVEHGYNSNSMNEEPDDTTMQVKESGTYPPTPMGGELTACKKDTSRSVEKYNDRVPYSPMNGISPDEEPRKEAQCSGNSLPVSLAEGHEEMNDDCCGEGAPEKTTNVTDSTYEHGSTHGMLTRHISKNHKAAILDEPSQTSADYGVTTLRHPYHTLAGKDVSMESPSILEQCEHTAKWACHTCSQHRLTQSPMTDPQNDVQPAGGRTVGGKSHRYTNVNGDAELRAPTYHLDVNTCEKLSSERSQLLSPTQHYDITLPNDNTPWLRLTSENLQHTEKTANVIEVCLIDTAVEELAEDSIVKIKLHVEIRKLKVEESRKEADEGKTSMDHPCEMVEVEVEECVVSVVGERELCVESPALDVTKLLTGPVYWGPPPELPAHHLVDLLLGRLLLLMVVLLLVMALLILLILLVLLVLLVLLLLGALLVSLVVLLIQGATSVISIVFLPAIKRVVRMPVPLGGSLMAQAGILLELGLILFGGQTIREEKLLETPTMRLARVRIVLPVLAIAQAKIAPSGRPQALSMLLALAAFEQIRLSLLQKVTAVRGSRPLVVLHQMSRTTRKFLSRPRLLILMERVTLLLPTPAKLVLYVDRYSVQSIAIVVSMGKTACPPTPAFFDPTASTTM